jgi:hypothetical protein
VKRIQRRTAIVAVILCLLATPAAVRAQSAATLAELAPRLSLGDAGLAPGRDAATHSPATSTETFPRRERVEPRGYSVEEVLDPIPLTSSLTAQPTYQQLANGGFNAYIKFRPILIVESGLPLFTRIEWPAPQVDDENGPTNVGVGDLSWLTLFLVGGSEGWGVFGLGPVFVFPTASHSEMGQGKYQVGPALGYVNRAVSGWQLALLVQQFFSFAGDPQRASVNQLTLQPFVTKLLPDSWYVGTQPTITVDFAKGTSSVPLDLVVGKVLGGRWNLNVKATVYPRWTSPPAKDYELTLSIGYHFPALLPRL